MTGSMLKTLTSALGHIPLLLPSWRAISSNDIPGTAGTPPGGVLAIDSAPKLIRVNAATDKGLKIEWAASSNIEITNGFFYPPDMDVTKAFTVNLSALMNGATDTPTLTVDVFEGIGGSNLGTTTAAMTAALANYAVTCTPVAGYPNFCSVSITPGNHTTNTLRIHNAWILYTKKLLTT